MSDDNAETPPVKRPKVESQEASFAEDISDLNETEFIVNNDEETQKENETQQEKEGEKLHEFKVLDEVRSNDEESNDGDSYSSDEKSEGVPEEEFEKMLEEDLPESFKGAPKPKERSYITRQKIVLEEKGSNPFEVLPLDWTRVRHHSGMPIYIHRPTRVCSVSRPYFIGKGNTWRHDIPISAIPCLAYKTALKEEAKQKEIDDQIEEQIRNGSWKNYINPAVASSVKQGNSVQNYQFPSSRPSADHFVNLTDKTKKPDTSNTTEQHNTQSKGKCPYRAENKTETVLDDSKQSSTDIAGTSESSVNVVAGSSKSDDGAGTSKDTQQDSNTTERVPFEDIPIERRPIVLPGGIVMPPPRIETVGTSWKNQQLSPEQVNDYCKNLFQFKTVNIMHFKRWADRRKYRKARKALQHPTLPEGTKVITIPAVKNGQDNGGKNNRRDWLMNVDGRSYLSVFHEYVCRVLQKQPVYEFKQLENASTPYQVTVFIGGMSYGCGRGASKRQAKVAAARASLSVLLPGLTESEPQQPDHKFFDGMTIEDPRIAELCAVACEPSPHAILRTCLLRNFGAGDTHIHTEMRKLEYQKMELTMRVGKHTAKVVCNNKKAAKQRASQAILQALHPHVTCWGSLLRLYGSRSVKSCKEKKLEEQQITLLQDKARHNEPNYAVLEKLRHEMRKLKERDEAVVPIGTLLLPEHTLPQHSGSNLNNVEI